VVVGWLVLALSCAAPWVSLSDRTNLGDIRHYHALADKILRGEVPYHAFFVEYPPVSLAIFLLPKLAGGDVGSYGVAFRVAAAVAIAITIVAVVRSIPYVSNDRRHLFAAAVFVGATPVFLGSVTLARYDTWAAAITSIAIFLVVSGRSSMSAAALGLGGATKVYPLLLLPLLLVQVARRSGRGAAARCAAIAGATFAAPVLPFAVAAPGGVAFSFKTQLSRVLEIESLSGALLLCAHRVSVYRPTIYEGLSFQLVGGLPAMLGTIQTVVLGATIAITWWLFGRRARNYDDVILAVAAVLAVTVAFNKVLSPQYLVWLTPVVALLWGRIGAVAWPTLVAAMLTTVAYFPGRFRSLRHGGEIAWLVLVRDLMLAALAGFLVVTCWRAVQRPSTSAAEARR
jgi:uncharacterized membrane protein